MVGWSVVPLPGMGLVVVASRGRVSAFASGCSRAALFGGSRRSGTVCGYRLAALRLLAIRRCGTGRGIGRQSVLSLCIAGHLRTFRLTACHTLCYRPGMAKKPGNAFVSMRIDASLLAELDQLAEVEGLTRTDVMERMIRRELRAFRVLGPLAEFRSRFPDVPFWPVEAEGGMVEVLVTCPLFPRKRGK